MGACQSSSGAQAISSSATNKSNLSSVKNTIKNHSNESSVTASLNQKVTINNMADSNDPLFNLKCQKYNFLGMKSGGLHRMYGATYDVNQNMNVKIVQINQDITEQSEQIYNEVSGKIQNDLTAALSTSQGQRAARDAVNDARDETVQEINDYLKSVADQTFEQDQTIEITQKTPFRFQGECGENKNPQINQNIIIDVVAENIVNMVTSGIQKKLLRQENKGKLEYDSTGGDMACEEQIGMGVIACLACLLCIFTIYYLTSEVTDTGTSIAKDVSNRGMSIVEKASDAGIDKLKGFNASELSSLLGEGDKTKLLEGLEVLEGLGEMDRSGVLKILKSQLSKQS